MSTLARSRWLAINYAATIFLSAFLLFQVQPLVSKHILPWFGGSPAVWTTCMLFFQTLLFGGYAYSHYSRQWLSPRRQALLHVVVLFAALVLLRVLPDSDWELQDATDPVWRILLLLTVSVGLPYFVLSTTGPLVQAWFSRSFPGRTPYRLYALSNVGSFLALLSYPVFFERWFDLPQQAHYWSWGFAVFACLCGLAAASVWLTDSSETNDATKANMPHDGANENSSEENAPPSWQQRFLWLALPAFASITLLATTNHVCSDVAVMPFLWVVPLACYLLTFIIAFDHPRWYRPTLVALFTLAAIYATAMVSQRGTGMIDIFDCATTGRCAEMTAHAFGYNPVDEDGAATGGPKFYVNFVSVLVFNFAAMFGTCLLCHGELARRRPHPRYLTSYFLMMAAGGALGGIAITLIAPHVFKTFFEWELVTFATCIWSLTIVLHALVNRAVANEPGESVGPLFRVLPSLLLALILLPAGLLLIDLAEYLAYSNAGVLLRERNFFGTLAVRERDADTPEIRDVLLQHGIIQHGSQFSHESRREKPTTYYASKSGVGLAIDYYRNKLPDGGLRIGAVGLGVGTLASYARAGDSISFYEINPAVRDITESGRWFTYLKDCTNRGGKYDIRMGDARLILARELKAGTPGRYHVLALDAFTGDAIPAHLLTEEAFNIYLPQLASAGEGGAGALAVHITNRYLELEPVVRGAAERCGLRMARIRNKPEPDDVIYGAEWVILSQNERLLAEVAASSMQAQEPPKPAILWTDSRSNLFDVLK